MSENYAISRIESYKYSDVGGVLKEALRILPNYNNPDCDPKLSYLNVNLVNTDLCGLSPEKYILKYREDNNIKGRFVTSAKNPKSLTNCMCQCLFTASSEYLSHLTRDEQLQYFKDCLDFFNSEFPSVHIIAANCHFDERTPHLHISYIPTVERVNKKSGELETIFSTTLLMPGKDFFPKYQDRFYNFISDKYGGFDRGQSDRKNMSVQDYKKYCDVLRENEQLKLELDLYRLTIAENQSRIDELYTELVKLRLTRSIFEDIPLLGVLVQLLKKMQRERQESVLKAVINDLEKEQKQLVNTYTPLSQLINDAESKVKPLSKSSKIHNKEI